MSTIIELSDVKKVDYREGSLKGILTHFLFDILDIEPQYGDWNKETQSQPILNIPEPIMDLHETADMYHKNYIDYLFKSWCMHRKVVFGPDHLWFTVINELGTFIRNNAKACANIFTTTPEQKKLIVVHQGDAPFGTGKERYRIHMERLFTELKKEVPVDTDMFVPNFSTTNVPTRWAFLAAFADAVSPYYSYMVFCCGYPAVRVLGTDADWQVLEDRIRDIGDLFSTVSAVTNWLNDRVLPVVRKIRESVVKKDIAFWNEILTPEKCGSGSQYLLKGWITDILFPDEKRNRLPKDENFPAHIAKVNYKWCCLGEEKDFTANYGLFDSHEDKDGFLIPEFHHITAEKK